MDYFFLIKKSSFFCHLKPLKISDASTKREYVWIVMYHILGIIHFSCDKEWNEIGVP